LVYLPPAALVAVQQCDVHLYLGNAALIPGLAAAPAALQHAVDHSMAEVDLTHDPVAATQQHLPCSSSFSSSSAVETSQFARSDLCHIPAADNAYPADKNSLHAQTHHMPADLIRLVAETHHIPAALYCHALHPYYDLADPRRPPADPHHAPAV
jgi:hypothetical protein